MGTMDVIAINPTCWEIKINGRKINELHAAAGVCALCMPTCPTR